MENKCDVAIIGGGPAGATVGTLLRKYNPRLEVLILERERFPRDHVGESQLPVISTVLHEMGAWDKVEAADFPVKVGATYRWGGTKDLWDFEFLPDGKFEPAARPAKFAGQRLRTAFQVDRARYDQILLEHAASMGCEVRMETAVRKVDRDGDRVTGLTLEDGSTVQARFYVDASGHAGILRRSMDVAVSYPTQLQNIAIWEYWQNADWAVSIGVGGTRIQVLSLPYGWLWFIPLGPERTSIGLVLPASYYKDSGKRPEELYMEAVQSDPVVSRLIRKAHREDRLTTTKDWSFLADRLVGENWFLAGESAGFADPILSAGMTLAHVGARDIAYTILALDRGDYEPDWLRSFYSDTHRAQIQQHIRFAEFWYTANGVFSDLKDHARQIATDAGLTLSAEAAWMWLGQGGFIERNSGTDVGQYGFLISKEIVNNFTGGRGEFRITGKTHFVLDLEEAEKDWSATIANGRIDRRRAYRRNGKILPTGGLLGWLIGRLRCEQTVEELGTAATAYAAENRLPLAIFWTDVIKSLEAMVCDGWVRVRTELGTMAMPAPGVDFSAIIHPNRDEAAA